MASAQTSLRDDAMKTHRQRTLVFCGILVMVLCGISATGARAESPVASGPTQRTVPSIICDTAPGYSFRKGTDIVGVAVGVGVGARILGSQKQHDLMLVYGHWGRMATGVIGGNHWYRGGVELWGELFGGSQYRPRQDFLGGLGIGLRYRFLTGNRWAPYIDAGSGVAVTNIGGPDLGSAFEFILQKNTALCVQARWFHLSNAGLTNSNRGANSFLYLVGVDWFF